MSFDGWHMVQATEYCLKVADGTHDSPKRADKGKPLITSKHIKGRTIDFQSAYLITESDYNKINLRSKVDQWDVLISMIGEYCGYCYVESNATINYAVKNVGIFKTGNRTKALWLYYYLNSPLGKEMLNSLRSGTSQPYISLGSLRSLSIQVPSDERRMKEIVDILSSLDERIELNRQTNQTLEAIAQALFKEWFVDFNFPGATGEMQDSELGKVPKTWQVGAIGDLFELQRGFDLPANSRREGSFPVIAASGLNGYHDEFKVKAPGITTGRSGVLGNVFYVQGNYWPLNTSLFIKTFKAATPLFSLFILRSIDLKSMNAGSAVPTLNRNEVHKIKTVVPERGLVHLFEKITLPLFQLIKNNEDQTTTLIQLRDGLLSKFMRRNNN